MLYAVQTSLPVCEIERLEPAVDAELAARRPDDHAVLHDKRRHRRRLAVRDVGHLRVPDSLPVVGVDGHRVAVEQVVDDLPVRVERRRG